MGENFVKQAFVRLDLKFGRLVQARP